MNQDVQLQKFINDWTELTGHRPSEATLDRFMQHMQMNIAMQPRTCAAKTCFAVNPSLKGAKHHETNHVARG